jgi:NADH-quinone oxidoreductase subunit M
MLAHGLVSGALFLCVGVIYDRLHTREIDRYGGARQQHALLCAVLHALHHGESWAARTSANFVGEFLALVGAYKANSWVAAMLATTGIILGAAYMLLALSPRRLRREQECRCSRHARPQRREWLTLAPIALATIWMGVYPESFMAPMRKDVGVLLARIEKAAPAGDAS